MVSKRTCTFWNDENLEWSPMGCNISQERSTRDKTICHCNHLTNFALLFDFTGDAEERGENKALDIASYVLLAISSAAIVATILIQFKFKKYLFLI